MVLIKDPVIPVYKCSILVHKSNGFSKARDKRDFKRISGFKISIQKSHQDCSAFNLSNSSASVFCLIFSLGELTQCP